MSLQPVLSTGKPFKAALIQMDVAGGEKQRNLRHAESLIKEAAVNGAALAVLPEALNLGWTYPSCRDQADSIPGGESYEALCASARNHGIYVCAGIVWK